MFVLFMVEKKLAQRRQSKMTGELFSPRRTPLWAPAFRLTGPGFPSQAAPTLTAFFLLASSLTLTQCQNIFQPPSITDPDRPKTWYFAADSVFSIPCTATGIPQPSYSWERDGQSIEDNQFVSYNSVTGDLTFTRFSTREEGSYICLAHNEALNIRSASLSHPQIVTVARIDTFGGEEVQSVDVNEYAYAKLECSNQNTAVGPDIQYGWYHKTTNIQVGSDNGRIFITSNGDLHFTYTLKSDQLDGGENYRCGIGSNMLNIIILGGDVDLTVNDAEPRAIRPILQYSNTGVQTILATTARLVCVFSGYDPSTVSKLPVITWTDDSNTVIQSDGVKYELTDQNKVLLIHDVQESDDRNYHCQASTGAGTSQVHSVRLNVTSAPLWVDAPKAAVVPVGSDVTIRCVARSLEGEQAPGLPQWRINGMPFSEAGKSKAALSDDKMSVTVKDVTKPDDIMCLQCFVQNSVGMAMGDACINVILGITVSLQCDRCASQDEGICSCTDVDLPIGESITFRFMVTTDPAYANQLNYQWTFNGVVYRDPDLPPHMRNTPENGVLVYTLSAVGLSQDQFDRLQGQYVYSVFHAYDIKNTTIGINLGSGTPGASSAGLGIDLWVIFFILAIIIMVAIIIIIVVCIVYRKLQEGDYNVDKKETKAGLDPAKELKHKNFPALSKPELEDDKKKPIYILEYDEAPIGADDESLGEYGVEEDSRFNEDGSFIGNYSFNAQPYPTPLVPPLPAVPYPPPPVPRPVQRPPSLNSSMETTI